MDSRHDVLAPPPAHVTHPELTAHHRPCPPEERRQIYESNVKVVDDFNLDNLDAQWRVEMRAESTST